MPFAKLSICFDRSGTPAGYMRIRGFPFSDKVSMLSLSDHEYCYVVEQSRDAQLRTLILNETSAPGKRSFAQSGVMADFRSALRT